MAGMTSKLARVLVGAAMGAGAVGVILALAGVRSPVRTGLVIVFLAVAPTAAIAGLLRSFDPFARLILAVVSTVVVLSVVAMLLLSSGLWSPTGELLGVAAITVGCLAAQRPSVQARLAAWARPGWQALLWHIPGGQAGAPGAETGTLAGQAAGNGQSTPAAGSGAAARNSGAAAANASAGAAAGNGQSMPGAGAGSVAGNRGAAPDAGTQAPGHGQAGADAAGTPGTGTAQLAAAEGPAGANAAGPTEVTTPLPAIRD